MTGDVRAKCLGETGDLAVHTDSVALETEGDELHAIDFRPASRCVQLSVRNVQRPPARAWVQTEQQMPE